MPLYEITGDVESARPEVKRGATVSLPEADGQPLVEIGAAKLVAESPAPKPRRRARRT
jgi:hypothetical protein